MLLRGIHHIAVICSDYVKSKQFYTELLGLEILKEHYRVSRDSFKLDLGLNGKFLIELFSFPNVPPRPSYPEACGLRHLAFAVENLDAVITELNAKGVSAEEVRLDKFTGKRFTFIHDPDGLPIELYQL
jgi:glyoxylase I family protein